MVKQNHGSGRLEQGNTRNIEFEKGFRMFRIGKQTNLEPVMKQIDDQSLCLPIVPPALHSRPFVQSLAHRLFSHILLLSLPSSPLNKPKMARLIQVKRNASMPASNKAVGYLI